MNKILKWVKSIFSFTFFFLVPFLVIMAIYLFDSIRPRDLIGPFTITILIISSALFLLLLKFAITKSGLPKLIEKINNLSRAQEIKVFLAFVVIMLLGILSFEVVDYFHEKRVLEEARSQFTVLKRGYLSDSQVNNTLIALQEQLADLRDRYIDNPPEYTIPIYIFSTKEELNQQLGRPDWVGASTRFIPNEAPIVFLPSEEGGGFLSKTAPTARPAHEITHVIEYEALELKSMKLVPTSFHEGIAQYESTRGFTNLFYRLERRFILLISSDKVLVSASLPDFYPLEDSNDVRLFYCVSFEFMRYLVAEYGEEKPWDLLKIIGTGEDFDKAVETVFGKEYSYLFQDFKKAFFVGKN